MFHILPIQEKRGEKGAVLGRVRHPRNNPKDYEVRVIKKGIPKVFIGNKSVIVIDDNLAEEIIKVSWERYINNPNIKRRGPRTNKEVVEHPIEVSESFLIEFFREKGLPVSYKPCMYLKEPVETKEDALEELLSITKKVKNLLNT
ncbi:hypothetical protein [Aquifex sp.]